MSRLNVAWKPVATPTLDAVIVKHDICADLSNIMRDLIGEADGMDNRDDRRALMDLAIRLAMVNDRMKAL